MTHNCAFQLSFLALAIGAAFATDNGVTDPATAAVAAAPIVIIHGGTYTGNWQSDNPGIPAVRVATTQPVTIANSTVTGRGTLISVDPGSNITITSVHGVGLNPNVRGRVTGRFIDAGAVASAIVQNCDLQHTAGIYFDGWQGPGPIRVLRNLASDIDGRQSDGNGGYLADVDDVQFVQFNKVRGIKGCEVAWNQVVNHPGQSRPEDVISVYSSRGTKASPIQIHDNCIDGAYPVNPNHDDYSGGGIMAGDGPGCAFVSITNNTVLATTNYGIACSSGHDIEISGNRVLASGRLADGSSVAAQNVAIYIWNTVPTREWSNIVVQNNVIGWMKLDQGKWIRNDFWQGGNSPATILGNVAYSGEITPAVEAREVAAWQARAAAQKIVIGLGTP